MNTEKEWKRKLWKLLHKYGVWREYNLSHKMTRERRDEMFRAFINLVKEMNEKNKNGFN
jgi:hypothetical protein